MNPKIPPQSSRKTANDKEKTVKRPINSHGGLTPRVQGIPPQPADSGRLRRFFCHAGIVLLDAGRGGLNL